MTNHTSPPAELIRVDLIRNLQTWLVRRTLGTALQPDLQTFQRWVAALGAITGEAPKGWDVGGPDAGPAQFDEAVALREMAKHAHRALNASANALASVEDDVAGDETVEELRARCASISCSLFSLLRGAEIERFESSPIASQPTAGAGLPDFGQARSALEAACKPLAAAQADAVRDAATLIAEVQFSRGWVARAEVKPSSSNDHLLASGAEQEERYAQMIADISESLGLTEEDCFNANGADKILAAVQALKVRADASPAADAIRALEVAREAIQANHQWHKDYDDHDGYEDSEIEGVNRGALTCVDLALRGAAKPPSVGHHGNDGPADGTDHHSIWSRARG